MEELELEILAPAQRELEEIATLHFNLIGAKSARKITDAIYKALENLKSHPMMGVEVQKYDLKRLGYRMIICGKYLCFYRRLADVIYVYHIADGRTDYPKLLKDLGD